MIYVFLLIVLLCFCIDKKKILQIRTNADYFLHIFFSISISYKIEGILGFKLSYYQLSGQLPFFHYSLSYKDLA